MIDRLFFSITMAGPIGGMNGFISIQIDLQKYIHTLQVHIGFDTFNFEQKALCMQSKNSIKYELELLYL
jgi:hypothetical protein